MICGGWTNEIKVADKHIQNLVNQVDIFSIRINFSKILIHKFKLFISWNTCVTLVSVGIAAAFSSKSLLRNKLFHYLKILIPIEHKKL